MTTALVSRYDEMYWQLEFAMRVKVPAIYWYQQKSLIETTMMIERVTGSLLQGQSLKPGTRKVLSVIRDSAASWPR